MYLRRSARESRRKQTPQAKPRQKQKLPTPAAVNKIQQTLTVTTKQNTAIARNHLSSISNVTNHHLIPKNPPSNQTNTHTHTCTNAHMQTHTLSNTTHTHTHTHTPTRSYTRAAQQNSNKWHTVLSVQSAAPAATELYRTASRSSIRTCVAEQKRHAVSKQNKQILATTHTVETQCSQHHNPRKLTPATNHEHSNHMKQSQYHSCIHNHHLIP
jgi:hypothetical protein